MTDQQGTTDQTTDKPSSLYGKPNFGMIVVLFALTILVVLVGALLFFYVGRHHNPARQSRIFYLPYAVSAVPSHHAS